MKTKRDMEAPEGGNAVRWTALLPWAVALGTLAALHGAGMVARHERVMVDTLAMMGGGWAAARCRGNWKAALAAAAWCGALAALLWLLPAG